MGWDLYLTALVYVTFTPQIQQYTEADMRNLKHNMSMEFQGILLLKEKEWHKRVQEEKKQTAEVQNQLEAARKKITAKNDDLKNMAYVGFVFLFMFSFSLNR